MSKLAPKDSKFKEFNKKLNSLSVPIIMKDIKRIEKLIEYKDKVKDVFTSTEIEDYIALLKDFCSEFKDRITNNLKAKDLSSEIIEKHLSKMLENAVVIGDTTLRAR